MSRPKVKDFLTPDPDWESTFYGRLNQGRRELAVALRKDVTAEKLAELISLSGPALAGWKRGSQPKKSSLEALEALFAKAGLFRYSARYLDWGPDGGQKLSEAPPVPLNHTNDRQRRG